MGQRNDGIPYILRGPRRRSASPSSLRVGLTHLGHKHTGPSTDKWLRSTVTGVVFCSGFQDSGTSHCIIDYSGTLYMAQADLDFTAIPIQFPKYRDCRHELPSG